MSAAQFALALIAPLSSADAAGVTGIELSDDKVVVRFDGQVEAAAALALSGPNRIALDIKGAEPGPRAIGRGLVATVRQGRLDNGARIVLDLEAPALVGRAIWSDRGRTLSFPIEPASQPQFDARAALGRKWFKPEPAWRAAPPRSSYSIIIPLAPPRAGPPRPKIYGPAGRPLVVIDAGHGGHDPGAISPITRKREKDVTLAIARQIKDELLKSGRVRVALTREDDRFLILGDRRGIARMLGAGLFISVHADAAPNDQAGGATIYTLSEVASDREAQRLAQRENRADVINGVNLGGENADIASILVDLAQRESMNASAQFASLFKREATRLVPFRGDYHKMAGFAVLKAPDIPSILLEVGYLTSAADVARISSKQGQANIAQGVRRAVEIHFARRLASR